MGYCTNSLTLGCDCLGVIKYFDGHLTTSRGEPLTIENAICMHEEDHGISWKHTDRRLPNAPEVRINRKLTCSERHSFRSPPQWILSVFGGDRE